MVYCGMKTAISIPDELFAAAEALAAKLDMSRSRLVAVALAEYIARHKAGRVTERLDAVYSAEESRPDATVRAAGARTLRRADW